MKEITFTYEPKDYSNYNKDTLSIKRILKFFLKTHAVHVSGLALLVAVFWTIIFYGNIYSWIFYAVLGVAFIIAVPLIFGYVLMMLYFAGGKAIQKQQKGVGKNVTLTIEDDTIKIDNGDAQTVFKWSSVKDVYSKKYNLLIFVADIQALIIPKRIFNSADEMNECWNYIQECYEKAKN